MAGYIDPFEQERKTSAAALAVGAAASVPAAQASQAAQLARRFRLPTPVAAQFADEYAARAQTEDARASLAKSPALASWIAEQPDRAQIAKNDLSTLSGLEQVARDYSGAVAEGIVGRGFGDVLSGAGRLYDAAARGIAAPLRAVGLGPLLDQPIPLWADPSYQLLKKPGQSLQNIGKMAGPAPENRTFGTDVASGLGQIAAQAGLYMLGGPVAGTATLYAGGAEAAGSKVDGDNASPMAKDLVTVGGAAITGVTEKYALDKILGPLAVPVRNQIAAALARIGIGAAAEGAQEMAENIGQDVLRKLITNPNAEIDFGESLYEGGVGAAVGGIARTAVEAALHIKRKQNVQQRADAGKDLLDKIVAAAGTTELHKADPAAFAALTQQMAQTTGAPAEVFIDARQVSEALQQSGITLEQAVAAMPSLADQLEAATIMGGDVIIPIGEFAAGIAGSPIEPLLMQHVRTEADGLSQADGKKKTAADQQMAGAAKKAEDAAANLTPLEKERETVKQDILAQLNATKRFTPDIHEAQAELTATVLANIARRSGKTIEQLFNGKPLNVQASGVFADALQSNLAQEAVTMSAAFKNWFGDSKVVGSDGKPLVVYHGAPDARFVNDDGVFKTIGEKYGANEPNKRAFWFTPDRRAANTYADDRRAFDYQNAEPGIVDAYLNLQNPLIVDGGGKEWRDAQARGKTSDVIKQAREGGHDGVIIRNVRDDYNNTPRTKATDTYVVFSSNQIKSATGNNGNFDPANPSILKQEAPTKPSPGHIEAMKREKVLNRLLECLSG